MGRKAIDLTGHRVGNLVVQTRAGTDTHGRVTWICLCDCGNVHWAETQSLRLGRVTRCPTCRKHRTRAPAIQIDVYFWECGLKGGFAVARDLLTGQILTHSYNSRTRLRTQDFRNYPQVRNVALRLANMGLIPPRDARKSWIRWFEDAKLRIVRVPITTATTEHCKQVWAEALATGTGPPEPDVDHGSDRRRTSLPAQPEPA